MHTKYAVPFLLSVLVAGLSQHASPVESWSGPRPVVAPAVTPANPGEPAAGHVNESRSASPTHCPAHGQPRETTYTRYWPFDYASGEVSATADRIVLDWVDYDASGVAEWYSYRYRPHQRLWDPAGWSPWVDVDDSQAVIVGLDPDSHYRIEVRAAVDEVVAGSGHHCFFTGPAFRTVHTQR